MLKELIDSAGDGETLDCTGKWLHLMSDIPPGNNLRSRLPGMLVKNVRILLGGMFEICCFVVSAGDEDCKNEPVGEDDSVGE